MADTKIQILDYAEHLARERGYDAFSYADIAQKINIKKASIHYHFPKKSDLALALITRYRDNLNQSLQDMEARDDNAASKIRAYINLYKEALSNKGKICLCIAFSAAQKNLSDAVNRELSLFREDNIKWLSHIFEKSQRDGSIVGVQDPTAEAYACHAMVQGAHLMARNDMAEFDNAQAQLSARLS